MVVARHCRRRVGVQRPVWGGGIPPYDVQGMAGRRGWLRRGQTRAPGREKRGRGGWKGDGGLGRREQGLPSPPDMGHSAIDADIESLYRRSPSHDLPLHHFSLALDDLGEWKVIPPTPLPSSRGRASARPLARSRHYHRRRGATGRDDWRAALKGFDRPCQNMAASLSRWPIPWKSSDLAKWFASRLHGGVAFKRPINTQEVILRYLYSLSLSLSLLSPLSISSFLTLALSISPTIGSLSPSALPVSPSSPFLPPTSISFI